MDGDNKGGALTITVPKDSYGTVFTGNTQADSRAEGNESFSMEIREVSGNEAQIQAGNGLHTTIVDIPTLTVTADKAAWSESGATPGAQNEMTFTISLTSAFTQATVVNLAWSGTAVNGTDYNGPLTVTIPAGVTSYTVRAPILDDALTESNETVTLTLKPFNGTADQPADPYHVGSSGFSAGTQIVDDTQPWPGAADSPQPWHDASGAALEGPQVRLVITDAGGTPLASNAANQIMENGGQVYYKLMLVNKGTDTPYTGTDHQAITVNIDVTGSNGALLSGLGADVNFTRGADIPLANWSYNAATGKLSVIIPSGQLSAKFSATSVADVNVEASKNGSDYTQEKVGLTITSVGNNEASIDNVHKSVETEIIDVPTASITSSAAYYSESGNPATPGVPNEMVFTVHLSSPVPYATTIGLNWDDTVGVGKAAYGADYTGRPTSVVIPAGQTEFTFRVPITDDAWSEPNETVKVSLKPSNGVADQVADPYHVSGAEGSVTVTIVDDPNPWPTTPDAGMPPPWHDQKGSLEEPQAPTHGPLDGALITITALDPYQFPVGGDDRNVKVLEDINQEGHITYRVQLVSRADGATAVNATENVTVSLKIDPQYVTADEHGVPYDSKYFAKYGSDVNAGDDFYLNLSKLLADYPNSNAGYDPITKILTMTIPATQSYIDFDINVVSDRLTETKRSEYDSDGKLIRNIPDESYNISIVGAVGGETEAHAQNGSINTTIAEELSAIKVSLWYEGDANGTLEGQNAQFRLTLSAAANEDVIVILQPQLNGSASYDDFAGATLKVVIPKGQTSWAVPIAVFNDTFTEGKETFDIIILDVNGGEAIIDSQRNSVRCPIIDDMNGPVLSVTADTTTVHETADPANPEHGVGGTATFTVKLSDPGAYPGNGVPSEAMLVTLKFTGAGANPAAITGAQADILLNSFKLPLGSPVTIESIDAAAGTVTVKVPKGFNLGEFKFSVDINDDMLTESAEQFAVSISKAQGSEATINGATNNAVVTIIDDSADLTGVPAHDNLLLDGPWVSISGTPFISESGGNATYTLRLTDDGGSPYTATQDVVVTVSYAANPGGGYNGATPSSDFEVITYTVTIPKGQSTANFQVRIADDLYSENNERFLVKIESATGNEARVALPGDAQHPSTADTVIVDDTQPWPVEAGTAPSGHGVLEGPTLKLEGAGSVYEPGPGSNPDAAYNSAQYRVTMNAAPVENITVTMSLKADPGHPGSGISINDFLGAQGASPADVASGKFYYDVVSGTFQSARLTALGITNFKPVDSADPYNAAKGWTFDVQLPGGNPTANISIPVAHDDLTEGNDWYLLKMESASGSEAKIGATSSIATRVVDDGSGPSVSLTVRDMDGPGALGWVRDGTLPNEGFTNDPGYDGDRVYLHVASSRAASEDITVQLRLTNGATGTTGDRGAPQLEGVDGTVRLVNGGTASAYYEIVIKAGTDHTDFSVLKLHGDNGSGTDVNYQDFYIMEVSSASGSESSRTLNVTTVDVAPPSGDVPGPYITLSNETPNDGSVSGGYIQKTGATPTPESQYVQEGYDATFNLHVDNNEADTAHTVMLKFRPMGGSYISLGSGASSTGADIDFSKLGRIDAVGNVDRAPQAGYEGIYWNYTTQTLVVNIPANTNDFQIKLPMATDSLQENTETYSLYLINGGATAHVDTNPLTMYVLDDFDGPTLTLHQSSSSVNEGGTHQYYFELDKQFDNAFNATLSFSPYGANPATSGQDYTVPMGAISFNAGSWTKIDLGGGNYVWRSGPVSVPIPDDEFSEGDETFQVKIGSVSTGMVTVDSTPLVTTITDVINGPKVYFTSSTATYGEDAAKMSFELALERPAAENTVVTVEIKGLGGCIFGEDFILQSSNPAGPGYLGPGYNYRVDGQGRHLIDITIPKGLVQTTLDLNKVLINDQLTENDEHLTLTIISAQGGEVRVDTAKNIVDVTVKDVLNGPDISVMADKVNIQESLGVDPAAPAGTKVPSDAGHADGKVTYTFSLPNGVNAIEPITVNFTLEAIAGNLLGVPIGQTFTVTIPTGQNSVTWTMDTLINDKFDEQASNESYRVKISSVTGNEAGIGVGSVTTRIIDDDHAPIANPDKIVILVPPAAAGGGTANIGVLLNDSDPDGDPISVTPGNAGSAPVYGAYTIDAAGNLTYTLDTGKDAVKKLSSGESLTENPYVYTVTDGYNPVQGQVSLSIITKTAYTGTSGVEWIFGGNQAETIKGNGGADVIHGGGGDDVIYDFGDGKAKLYGDAGNDAFVVAPKGAAKEINPDDFSYIEGGAGLDRIKIEGADLTLNFTADKWDGSGIVGVEILDITGTGRNTLKLDSASVEALTSAMEDPSKLLRVVGNDGDSIDFVNQAEGWVNAYTMVDFGADGKYNMYIDSAGHQVLVSTAMSQVVYGTVGVDAIDVGDAGQFAPGNYTVYGLDGDDVINGGTGNDNLYGGAGNDTLDGHGGKNSLFGGDGKDTLIARDTTGDGLVTDSDFTEMHGGAGVDTLRLDNSGSTDGIILDFTNIAPTVLTGIEYIDLNGSGGKSNGIILSDAALNSLSGSLDAAATEIRVIGSAGDMFELSGATLGTPGGWHYDGKVVNGEGGWYKYHTDAGKVLLVQSSLTRVITGTGGSDTIAGGAEDSVIIRSGAGNDTVNGGAGNELIYGGDGDDILHGGAGLNVIYGGAGNDTLYNDAATDKLYGEGGNDTFIVKNNNGDAKITGVDFDLIAGGAGVDTLSISGSGLALDLSAVAAGQIKGVESFALGAGNHIKLDSAALHNILTDPLDGAQPQVRVTGTATSTFELDGDWAFTGLQNSGGNTWLTYKSDQNEIIWVQNTMQRVYVGGAGPDAFILDNVSGDAGGVINYLDFASITGNGGTDTLTPGGDNLTFDLTTLNGHSVSGISGIDLSAQSGGHVIMGSGVLTELGVGTFTISGGATDSFQLSGAWTFDPVATGADSDFRYYTDSSGKVLKVDKDMLRVYQGTTANDSFVLDDVTLDGVVSQADFKEIKGGGGVDEITLAGSGKALDLRGLDFGAVSGLSAVNLTGGGNNHIFLDDATLTLMGLASGAELLVKGSTGDTFTLDGDWTFVDSVTRGGNPYFRYKDNAGRFVLMQSSLGRDFIGTDSADSFILSDVTGDGKISGADFHSIAGLGGTDTLFIDKADTVLDLSGLDQPGAGVISGVECIDTSGYPNTKLIFDPATLTAMGVDELKVAGGDTDTFILSGAGWLYVGRSGGGECIYMDAAGKELHLSANMKRIYDGSANADTMVLDDVSDDGVITAADFASISGGLGVDTIAVGSYSSGVSVNLTGLPAGVISGIERIDLSGAGGNLLVLDAQTLTGMGLASGGVLTVTGTAEDSFQLSGDWSYVSTGGGYCRYSDGAGRLLDVSESVRRVYQGSTGDDTFRLEDITGGGVISLANDVSGIHGLGGTDAITVSADNITLDLTGLPKGSLTKIDGIEVIDLSGTQNNHVVLDEDSISGMDLLIPLVIRGNATDTFELKGTWTYQGLTGDSQYFIYQNAASQQVHIATAMRPVLNGDSGNNVFTLYDLNGDSVVDGNDFTRIAGGGGSDTLKLGASGANNAMLDLTSLAAGKVSSVRTIDVSGAGNNHVVLGAATLANMGLGAGDTLTISGNVGDTFDLKGAGWTYTGTSGGFHHYAEGGRFLEVADTLAREVRAGDGGESISSQIATDILLGGAGADTFNLADLTGNSIVSQADVGRVSGGGGLDVLSVEGNLTLDLTTFSGLTLQGIETFRLNGAGGHVVINESVLDNLTPTLSGQAQVRIEGGAGNTFELVGAWIFTGKSGNWLDYTDTAGNHLYVADTLQRVYNEAQGGKFVVDDLSNDGLISGSDFSAIYGHGTEVLTFGGSNEAIDLTGLVAGKISAIAGIDLTGHGANHLSMDDGALTAMGVSSLAINGDAADSYELTGNWTWQSQSGGQHVYSDGQGHTLSVAEDMTRIVHGGDAGAALTAEHVTTHLIGGAGDDVFSAVSGTGHTFEGGLGDDIFNISALSTPGQIVSGDYAGLHGGAGFDTLAVHDHLDLTALSAGTVSGIDHIALDEGKSLTLTSDLLDSILDNGSDTLEISGGGAGSTLSLSLSGGDVLIDTGAQAQGHDGTMYNVYNVERDDSSTIQLLIHNVTGV